MRTAGSSAMETRMIRRLDVLMPHFNDPDGLDLSLRSIARQTWNGSTRVVIVDDGSSPENRASAEAVVEKFRRYRTGERPLIIDLLVNATNRGRPFSRNVLLDAIDSPFVAWLDAGDEWYSGKIEIQFNSMEAAAKEEPERPLWITCNYDWLWSGGQRKKLRQRTDQDQCRALLMGSKLRAYLWTLMGTSDAFKRVGYFDERLPRMQDLDFFIRFVSEGGAIRHSGVDDPLCVYHKSDVGRDADEIRACNALIFEKHRHLYNKYGEKFSKMRLFNMEMLAARFAQNNEDRAKARLYMWKAFQQRPIAFLKHVRKRGFAA